MIPDPNPTRIQDLREIMGKNPCEASSMFGFETRPDGVKAQIEGASRAHIKVLMTSASTLFKIGFDMAILDPKQGSSRCRLKAP